MDADLVVFDPATPFEFSTRTSHMNVDYDLFEGETLDRQRAPHALPRRRWSTTAARSAPQPGHGRFVAALAGRAAAAVAS